MDTQRHRLEESFIIRKPSGRYAIDWRRIPAESVYVTTRLVREVARHAHLFRGAMLDIGCGTKPYSVIFAPHVDRIVGIDVPTSMHSQVAVDAFASAGALPFRSDAFNCVLCTEVLEHVPEPRIVYQELSRVLQPAGYAIITTPFMYRIHEAPYDFYRYTPFSHRHLAAHAGLEVISINTRGGILSVFYDLCFKWNAVVAGGISRLLWPSGQRHLLTFTPVKFLFSLPQRLLAFLAANENLKSDIYTLGYVVVLRKPDS